MPEKNSSSIIASHRSGEMLHTYVLHATVTQYRVGFLPHTHLTQQKSFKTLPQSDSIWFLTLANGKILKLIKKNVWVVKSITTLPENPGLIPSTQTVAHKLCNSSPRESSHFLLAFEDTGKYVAYWHTCRQNTHKIRKWKTGWTSALCYLFYFFYVHKLKPSISHYFLSFNNFEIGSHVAQVDLMLSVSFSQVLGTQAFTSTFNTFMLLIVFLKKYHSFIVS